MVDETPEGGRGYRIVDFDIAHYHSPACRPVQNSRIVGNDPPSTAPCLPR